jgi:carbon starvation protein
MGKARYAWVTFLPLTFVMVTTLTAGYMSVRDNYWPRAIGPNPALHVQGYILTICTVLMMVLAVVLLVSAGWRCLQVLTGRVPQLEQARS